MRYLNRTSTLCAAAIGLAIWCGLSLRPVQADTSHGGTLAVLLRPATSADVLPKALARLPISDQFLLLRAGTRLYAASRAIGVTHGISYYVVQGRNDELCIVGTRGSGTRAENFGSCSAATLLDHGLIYTGKAKDARDVEFAAIVPNGFSSARSQGHRVAVVNSAIFMTVRRGRVPIDLIGSPGQSDRHIVLHLGSS